MILLCAILSINVIHFELINVTMIYNYFQKNLKATVTLFIYISAKKILTSYMYSKKLDENLQTFIGFDINASK